MSNKKRPLIAISACLLGTPVRYNNNHCQEDWIVNELSKFVDFYPLCPEIEMKLGVPREEMHLYYNEEDKNTILLRTKKTKKDLTELAEKTNHSMNQKMQDLVVDGFILTKKSPSCGLTNITAINAQDPSKIIHSQGLFAKNITECHPSIPKIDSGRIRNVELREQFIKSVFAHFRFKNLDLSIGDLQDFHKKYKYIIMDHSPNQLKLLGQIASNIQNLPPAELYIQYYRNFFQALNIEATAGKRYNSLLHIMGYFKKYLGPEEKQEILVMFDEFKTGILNYMTPQHFFEFLTKKHKEKYLEQQYFFSPYPKELKIHKHI